MRTGDLSSVLQTIFGAGGGGRWFCAILGSERMGRNPKRPFEKREKMADFPDVVSLATKVTNTVIQYYNIEDSEWRLAKKTKDTTVWRKPSEEFNGYLYKTQGIVEDVTNRIIDHIRPGPYRLHWDSLMTTMDIVDEFEDNCCVMRYTTAGQLWNIIAPREFIDFSCTTDYEDGLLSCGISLDYGEVRPNFVRGFNHPCGWFCFPLKDNPRHSLLMGFIQTDLRGMLPQSAVDTAMASTLANFYSDLRKALKA
ncbi:stAR-related lipid transfer protein 4 isoform X1 [Pogona vitticeps]